MADVHAVVNAHEQHGSTGVNLFPSPEKGQASAHGLIFSPPLNKDQAGEEVSAPANGGPTVAVRSWSGNKQYRKATTSNPNTAEVSSEPQFSLEDYFGDMANGDQRELLSRLANEGDEDHDAPPVEPSAPNPSDAIGVPAAAAPVAPSGTTTTQPGAETGSFGEKEEEEEEDDGEYSDGGDEYGDNDEDEETDEDDDELDGVEQGEIVGAGGVYPDPMSTMPIAAGSHSVTAAPSAAGLEMVEQLLQLHPQLDEDDVGVLEDILSGNSMPGNLFGDSVDLADAAEEQEDEFVGANIGGVEFKDAIRGADCAGAGAGAVGNGRYESTGVGELDRCAESGADDAEGASTADWEAGEYGLAGHALGVGYHATEDSDDDVDGRNDQHLDPEESLTGPEDMAGMTRRRTPEGRPQQQQQQTQKQKQQVQAMRAISQNGAAGPGPARRTKRAKKKKKKAGVVKGSRVAQQAVIGDIENSPPVGHEEPVRHAGPTDVGAGGAAGDAGMSRAQLRHMKMLADMAQKKQETEEAARRDAVRRERAREKLRAALLERAAARAAAGVNHEERASFQAGTAASKSSGTVRTGKKGKDADEDESLTAEERAQREKDRYEEIAERRRRFKERHKKTLAEMAMKRKSDKQKREEDAQKDAARKDRQRRRTESLLLHAKMRKEGSETELRGGVEGPTNGARADLPVAERQSSLPGAQSRKVHSNAPAAAADAMGAPSIRYSQSAQTGTSQSANGLEEKPAEQQDRPTSAAGSGMAAVRAQSQTHTTSKIPQHVHRRRSKPAVGIVAAESSATESAVAPTGGEDCVPDIENTEENDEEAEARRAANKAFIRNEQLKLRAHLDKIAKERQQKQQEEEQLKRRLSRRISLLQSRILSANMSGTDADASQASTKLEPPTGGTGGKASERKDAEEPKKKSVKKSDNSNNDNSKGPPTSPITSPTRRTVRKSSSGDNGASAAGDATDGARAEGGMVLTAEQEEAMLTRLTSMGGGGDGVDGADGAGGRGNAVYRDYADWKRKTGVPEDGKVFAMTGWYPCVKETLQERGWYFNPDRESPFFDLKWTLRSTELKQDSLEPWQLTNHFLRNTAITTKVGLLHSLRSLSWFANVQDDLIFPRGYDLSNDGELSSFLDDYRSVQAESILKALYKKATGLEQPPDCEPHPLDPDCRRRKTFGSAQASVQSSRGQKELDKIDDALEESAHSDGATPDASVAANVADSDNGEDPDGASADKVADNTEDAVAETTDAVLSPRTDDGNGDEDDAGERSDDVFVVGPAPAMTEECKEQGVFVNAAVWRAAISVCRKNCCLLNESDIDDPRRAIEPPVMDIEWEVLSTCDPYAASSLPDTAPAAVDAFLRTEKTESEIHQETVAEKRQRRAEERRVATIRAQMAELATQVVRIDAERLQEVHEVLCSRRRSDIQFGMNGLGTNSLNMWIAKPAAKSRGRGICTFRDLGEILNYVEASNRGSGSQWVIQKYMENPLIIAKRKFDIRQWVLVTSWNPLTVWFYNECYVRFGVEEYTSDDASLGNSFVHLVNNSIGKNSEKFNQSVCAEQTGQEIEGYMWSSNDFREFLASTTGRDMFEEKIQPRMRQIATWSLMCAQDMIEHRKNSWELYGYDFMVDSDFQAWLIEINSSPACDYSTGVTERFVQKALTDVVKVVIDRREWDEKPKSARSATPPDTGGWERVHKGPLLKTPPASLRTDIVCKGTALRVAKPAVTRREPSESFLRLTAPQARTRSGAGAEVKVAHADPSSGGASSASSAQARIPRVATLGSSGAGATDASQYSRTVEDASDGNEPVDDSQEQSLQTASGAAVAGVQDTGGCNTVNGSGNDSSCGYGVRRSSAMQVVRGLENGAEQQTTSSVAKERSLRESNMVAVPVKTMQFGEGGDIEFGLGIGAVGQQAIASKL